MTKKDILKKYLKSCEPKYLLELYEWTLPEGNPYLPRLYDMEQLSEGLTLHDDFDKSYDYFSKSGNEAKSYNTIEQFINDVVYIDNIADYIINCNFAYNDDSEIKKILKGDITND